MVEWKKIQPLFHVTFILVIVETINCIDNWLQSSSKELRPGKRIRFRLSCRENQEAGLKTSTQPAHSNEDNVGEMSNHIKLAVTTKLAKYHKGLKIRIEIQICIHTSMQISLTGKSYEVNYSNKFVDFTS